MYTSILILVYDLSSALEKNTRNFTVDGIQPNQPARRILALLAADPGRLGALVDVGARLAVVEQLVPGIALAVVGGGRVNATMAALVELDASALVDVAVGWLVRAVLAVEGLVADELLLDALARGAAELIGIRAGRVLALRCCGIFIYSLKFQSVFDSGWKN